jgi:hypothetical protein
MVMQYIRSTEICVEREAIIKLIKPKKAEDASNIP